MKLENQVTCRELSEKLKELGIKQESLWCYVIDSFGKSYICDSRDNHSGERYSAFTVAELGEMLPEGYITSKNYLRINKWHCWKLYSSPQNIEKADTEANARAKMLICLTEQGEVK